MSDAVLARLKREAVIEGGETALVYKQALIRAGVRCDHEILFNLDPVRRSGLAIATCVRCGRARHVDYAGEFAGVADVAVSIDPVSDVWTITLTTKLVARLWLCAVHGGTTNARGDVQGLIGKLAELVTSKGLFALTDAAIEDAQAIELFPCACRDRAELSHLVYDLILLKSDFNPEGSE